VASLTKLNVHRFGSTPPSVLLLHGLSSSGPVWWRIGTALEKSGYAAVAPDLRGHGGSAHPDIYSLGAYTEDALETAPGPWHVVVGHSLGGAVAVQAAAANPDFAAAYLLIDPAITFDRDTAEAVHTSIVADVTDPPAPEQLLADHPQWSREDADHKRASLLATSVDVIQRTFEDNQDWQLGDQLRSITRPVHILGADDDPLYTAEDFAIHQSGAATFTFEQVLGSGHSIYRDRPETVIERALSLLSTIPAP
jgi:pimeloyl-ACP methyl ester carboxylesterase